MRQLVFQLRTSLHRQRTTLIRTAISSSVILIELYSQTFHLLSTYDLLPPKKEKNELL